MLVNVLRNLKRTAILFLQGTPEGLEIRNIEQRLLSIDGTIECHSTHLWSLDGDQHVLSSHLVLDPESSSEDVQRIKRKSRAVLQDLSLSHITLEVELGHEDCSMAKPQPAAAST